MLTGQQISALRKERAEYIAQARQVLDGVPSGRDMNDAECKEFKRLHDLADNIGAQLLQNQRESELAELQYPAGFDPSNVAGSAARQRPGNGSEATAIDQTIAAMVRSCKGDPVPHAEIQAAESLGFNPHGSEISIPLGECKHPILGSEVRFGANHSGPNVSNALTKAIPSLGGTTVPGSFMSALEKAVKAYSTMFRVAEVIVTEDGRSMGWPMLDDADNEGVQIGENAEASDSDLAFKGKMFGAYKFTSGIVWASHEILRDSAPNLSREIGSALGERIGRILNNRATLGTGAATIMGIVNEATVGKTAAATGAVTMDELIDLQHSVDPGHVEEGAKPGWMFNNTTAGVLRKLKDSQNRYLWMDSPREGQPDTLLGAPVRINQYMPDIGASAKPVLFGDYMKFKLRVVGKLRLRVLKERRAEFDQVGFIGFMEADGALLVPSSNAALSPVRSLQMAAS